MQVRRTGRFVYRLSASLTNALFSFLSAFVFLNLAAAAPVTFCKQVAPILYQHCVTCHRPGQIAASSSLLTYADSARWADAIKEKVWQREMPPWPADSIRSAKFRNDPRLTQQEIDTLIAWINAGAPKGDEADLPPAPHVAEGWL